MAEPVPRKSEETHDGTRKWNETKTESDRSAAVSVDGGSEWRVAEVGSREKRGGERRGEEGRSGEAAEGGRSAKGNSRGRAGRCGAVPADPLPRTRTGRSAMVVTHSRTHGREWTTTIAADR